MTEMRPLCEPNCPLCGGPNECVPARTGCFELGCWCREIQIPRDVLARIPEPFRGKACLCRPCCETAVSGPGSEEESQI